ncbi:MAG TPA: aldose epimerase family protein [Rhizomicrobium sp.]|nr:aldose epimerase family protein [Rhizomicrobium sp.]
MTRTLYGHKQDGTAVHAYSLGAPGGLTATVLDMGGTITAIRVPAGDAPRGDGPRNVVRGLADLAAYEASGWWNCLIGRYANRIAGGFTLDGRHHVLPAGADGVTLHGSRPLSWGTRLWTVVEAGDDTLTLRLVSPDGDQGFPGTLTAEVTYSATGDALRLDYRAAADAPTPVNLTNHIYFNLAGGGSVTDQTLQLNADRFTPTDARQIPTGEIADVAGTAFDFRAPAPIGARVDSDEPQMRLAGGYDHNVVLNKPAPGALEWAARMRDPESGLMLELWTTEPGMQVYSANNVRGGQFDAAGRPLERRGALALETQHFPDSPNRPQFPSTILRPGETFRSTTVFRFSRE